ncbi:MAG: IS66 family transposase, partial [Bdellovibrio sp.]
KSERWESPEQALLFDEAEVESKKRQNPAEVEEVEIEVGPHTRKRGHRKPLPESLPREIIKLELPPEEQVTDDGTKLKIIGWELSEKLKYEPSKMSVIQYHRAKYGVDQGDYVKTAPAAPSVIPKGIATPELLAATIVGKYVDGMPLYRMEYYWQRHGVELTRGTMARWVIKVAEALMPIWNVLSDRLLASMYVAVDETHVQVLKENGRRAEDKSWMWVRSTPADIKKIILFDYSPSRSQATAKTLLTDLKGYLQCDGLAAYDQIAEQENIVRIGCAMHARRRFEKAAVDGAKSGKSLGAEGLKFFKDLYDLEEDLKDKDPIERHRLRLELEKPIWEQLKTWSEQNIKKLPKKSKIGEAFSYLLNQYDDLVGYLKDGCLNIDNGFTERAIRKFAIGRNNWMFSDSVEGANASALLYSLVVTAKVNGVDPYKALVKIIKELPLAKNIEDFERLADVILTPENPV